VDVRVGVGSQAYLLALPRADDTLVALRGHPDFAHATKATATNVRNDFVAEIRDGNLGLASEKERI
jgi:hypothetical protein